MIKLKNIILLALISKSFVSQSQVLTTKGGASLNISAGSILHIDGLMLYPSANFTIEANTSISVLSNVTHPAGRVTVNKAFVFSKPLKAFNGNIEFSYSEAELQGLSEDGLELQIFNGVNWQPSIKTSQNIQLNKLSSLVNEVDVHRLILIDKKRLFNNSETRPLQVLSNPLSNKKLVMVLEKSSTIVLLNLHGQVLESKNMRNGWNIWDLAKYPKGNYILRDISDVLNATQIIID